MKFLKGQNSVKKCSGVIVTFSAHCLIMLYICTKFRENISKGSEVIEQKRFSYLNFQMVLFLSKMLVELKFLIAAGGPKMLYIFPPRFM